MEKSDLPLEHPLRKNLATCYKCLNQLCAEIATSMARHAPPPTTSPSSTASKDAEKDESCNLPKTDVPTFHGDLMKWTSFWAQFDAIIHSIHKLPDSRKLAYLRQAIKEPAAAKLLTTGAEEPGFYQEVVLKLNNRFHRTREIHQNYCKAINKLPDAKCTQSDLTELVDTVETTISSLKRTGQYDLDSFIASTVTMALPVKLQTLWEQHSKKEKGVPPLEALLEFISDYSLSLHPTTPSSGRTPEHQDRKPAKKQERKQDSSFHRQKSNIHVSSSSVSSYRWECRLCRPERHPLFLCPKWEAMTVTQRMSYIQANSLCQNCLAAGNQLADCKSPHKCRDCGQSHHTSIHQNAPPVPINSSISWTKQLPNSLLMTANVLITAPGGQTVKARALIDPGATLSLVSNKLTKKLKLPKSKARITFTGVQGTPCKAANHVTELVISPLLGNQPQVTLTAAVVDKVTEDLPSQELPAIKELPHLQGLELSDPEFHKPNKIDLLIGAEVYPRLLSAHDCVVIGPRVVPAATIFGWVVCGPVNSGSGSEGNHSTHFTQGQVDESRLDDLLSQFWETEEPESPAGTLSSVEEMVQEHYLAHTTYSSSSCRYKVTLPKRSDIPPLGDSRAQALQRYMSNEKSIIRKGIWRPFQDVVQGYLDLGHAELVPPSAAPPEQNFYLPMHSVSKQTSTSTKLRVVFDGSAATSSGFSLNQSLLVGPTLHSDLSNILLRFRSHIIAVSAGIKQMYREVKLTEEDKDLHRFLWRPTPQQVVQDYRMTRVTFGVSASPYLAVRTLQQTAADHGGDYPAASQHILQPFYVDDLLAGAPTVEEALELYSNLRAILAKGFFNLCKWRSSSTSVLEGIPPDLQEKLPVKEVTTNHSPSQPKALGLEWDSRLDLMFPSIHLPNDYRKTKRGIVSDVARTFDILGWISPSVLVMKALYQQLWSLKIGWDEEVPPAMAEQHSQWREQLPLLVQRQLPRCYFRLEAPCITTEIHGFSDASEKAFGAVIYIRSHHSPVVALVISKTKVASLKPTTIPRLELCGAKLLATLMTTVGDALDIPKQNRFAWSDSSIVLSWLDGRPRDYKPYVSNRVAAILQELPPTAWRHVPTRDIPVDCASRGLMPKELLSHTLWWEGFRWSQSKFLGSLPGG